MIHKTTRSILSVLLAALLLVTSVPLTPAFADGGAVSRQSESGEGRALEKDDAGVYQIGSADELREFAEKVNGGETDANTRAELTDDIDLNNQSWYPIGTSSSNPYSGTFDGNGHTISGLYIDSDDNDQGLFGYVSGSGKIENLSVSGSVSVSGSDHVGGVVGLNLGTVINCAFSGSVSGSDHVGGVVGYNNSSVENCYNTGSVNGGNSSVGGVVGYNGGSVTNSYNTGAVSGGEDVGGVVGYNISSVTNCYNTGSVKGDWYVGGVVGYNIISTVTGCYFLKQNGVPAQGIGSDSSAAGAAAVDDLDALCGKFESDPWTISPFCKHPVLKTNPEGGLGTAAHPYEIKTADQLETFRDIVNGTNDQTEDPDAHAKLMNDIDLNPGITFNADGTYSSPAGVAPQEWTPIGNEDHRYTGTFNGAGHTIKGLYINDSSADYQGLFGYVSGYVGTRSTVQNLSVSGSVSGHLYVGGVVGYNRGSVENCYNTGEVSGPNSGTSNYVGGVVGDNSGSVTNCYNTGTVTGTDDYVGGVVGQNSGGSVTNCYFLKTADVNKDLSGIGLGGEGQEAIQKTADAFHSGEVAYLLEQKVADSDKPVWGQRIGEDDFPVLFADPNKTVYQVKINLKDSADSSDTLRYTNSDLQALTPTREGYTFDGWYESADCSGEAVTTITDLTDNTATLYAKWTPNTYTVTLHTNDGTIAEGQNVTSYIYGVGAKLPTENEITKTGYIFAGWYNNADLTGDPVTEISKTDINDKTYWAKWEEVENPEPDPTPTPTPDPTPSGPSTDGSSGWDDIRDELENTAKGDQITIDMGDETKVPAEIFESLAGKDVEISFDLGDDLSWTVNGKDIPDDAALADLDLGVALDTDGIPANVVNAITGEVGTVQITLAHDGEFGFTMTLTAPLGVENSGYWANLYHYDEDAEALNFEAAAKIDETGSVTIPFSHASQYAIVIDTHSHAAVDVSDIFLDIAANAWYKDAVQYAYDNGLMTGVSATEFAPEATTTRAMIVSILARLEGVTTAEAAGFADVDDNDWYATAVNWAANVGVVNGYEDNTFRPNTAITREQLAAILMNYAAYKGEDVSARADLTSYTDQPSTWAEEAMSWAVAEGLINGVTADTLQPQGAATRAQVAAILQRFLSE